MNELQVKTIKLEPAVVEFNKNEIEQELNKHLEKYRNLTFTEENTAELRKTLAELRKGKEAVNRYRIDTKKELTAPVTEFENDLKKLAEQFETVIAPLDKDLKEYEERRRAEKELEVQGIVEEIVTEFSLLGQYAERIEIKPSYLTKSKSLKSIEEDIRMQAKLLEAEQVKFESDCQIVESTVKLVNAEHNVNFSPEPYIRLLEFNDVADVKKQILDHAQKESKKRIEEKANEKTEFEKVISEMPAPEDIPDLPFGNIGGDEKRNVTLGLMITVDQLEELKKYLDYQDIYWEEYANDRA